MWNPKIIDTDKALYVAIADAMERDIGCSILKPGEKMPTHRDLADIIGVNVTTITRAYKEAERRGLMTGTVGRGTFVKADAGMDSAILEVENYSAKLIEMGLVLPLYNCEAGLSKTIAKLARNRNLNRYLRYSDPLGLPEHRDTGANWVKRFGITATSGDMVICAGAQHALTCCLQSLFEAGDRIAVDSLTYPGFKAAAKAMGIKLEPVAMDGEGMIPEELETVCRREKIKGLYLMPNVQNPTNASMSMRRKAAIAAVIERNGLLLIEDDIYSFAQPENMQAVTSLIPGNSIYIAGVSKAFYAGLRIAFIFAPGVVRYKIAQAVVNTIWMAPTLNAEIVSQSIRDGTADEIILAKLKELSFRFDLAKEKLKQQSFSGKHGSHFIWLNLPDGWNNKEFELAAREKGVNVYSADKFAVGGNAAPTAVRISLSGAEDMEKLDKGLTILETILIKNCSSIDMIL